MVDKKVGTAGTLRITDDGEWIRFYVLCSDPATRIANYRWSGTVNGVSVGSTVNLQAGFGSRLLGTWRVTTSQKVSWSQQATGTQGLGGAASVSLTVSRPKPNAPSNLLITRVSDTQHTLNWNRTSTYTSCIVQRREASGSAWSSWVQIATPGGNASTYTDKSTKANRRYEYRVAGKNANGTSGWSGTAGVYTTPAVPTGVSAARSGSNIVVNASGKPPYATSYDVRDGSTVVGSNVTLPWTHTSPNPAVTHQYTVRAKRGSLASGYSSASNVVQLLTRPNPPTSLAPNGAVLDAAESVKLTWRHNSVDSSLQSSAEVRRRVDGGSWVTQTVATAESLTIPDLDVGSWEWQVRTKGEHPDWSDWSSVATITLIDQPGVAILTPEDEWDSATLHVEWSWFQAQDRPQSSYELELLDDSLTVVDSIAGSGSATTAIFAHRLTEGTYTVRVRAATGAIWSEWAETVFEAVFVPPAPPMLTGVWNEAEGGVDISVAPGGVPGPVDVDMLLSGGRMILWDALPGDEVEVVASDAPSTDQIIVERFTDGAWETVLDSGTFLAPGGNADGMQATDMESPSYGDIPFRATAFSADGAASVTEILVVVRSRSIWLSGGPGLTQALRLPLNPSVQHTASRSRAVKRFAGRPDPVTYSGEALSRTVTVSGLVTDQEWMDDTASPDDLVRLSQSEEELFLFRDPDGRRIYGTIGEIPIDRHFAIDDGDRWNAAWGYSFTLTEATSI